MGMGMEKHKGPPLVSVLTISRNREDLLSDTIISILSQTFSDFEYIIIDDNSEDNSEELIQAFVKKDNRIRFFKNETQLGQSNGVNRYLSEIRGDYTVMIDSDDICLPTRIADQVYFLEQNPTFGAVGCQQQLIDLYGNPTRIRRYPLDPILAKWNLLFSCPIMNSALTLRTSILRQLGGYLDSYRYVCDYELVSRIAEIAEIGSLPTVLVNYRLHPNQMTNTNVKDQVVQMLLLQANLQQRWLGLIPKLHIHNEIQTVVKKFRSIDLSLREECLNWLDKMNTEFISKFQVTGTQLDLLVEDFNKKRSILME